jgi:hypothetical protein
MKANQQAGAIGYDAARSSLEGEVAGLADLLISSLETLADLGQADAACREAGRACAVLRGANPAQWRKFNALLHRLSKHVQSG